MPDFEKTIHALICRAANYTSNCKGCSYYNFEWACCDVSQICVDVVELLKEYKEDHDLLERARMGEIVLDYPTPEQRKRDEEKEDKDG